MSQSAIAEALGVTQSNVSFYENETKPQTVPPAVAARLIEVARAGGLSITYDSVYGAAELPPEEPAKRHPRGERAAADIYSERNDEAVRRLERITRGERRER